MGGRGAPACLARSVVGIALSLGGGCADLLDIPDSPALVIADPWKCEAPMAQAQAPVMAPPPADRARVTVHACNIISTNCSTPVTGLTAKLCNKRDVTCSAPVQAGLGDVNGSITFDVPTGGALGTGFDGYLMVSAPDELCTNEAAFGGTGACALAAGCDETAPGASCKLPTYVPALLVFNPPVNPERVAPFVLPLVPSGAGLSLITATGARGVEDRRLGFVLATALDCDGAPAAGLTLGAVPPPQAGVLYQENGTPSVTATMTDAGGTGALLGVPAGFVRVAAYAGSAADMREVGSIDVLVQSGTITYVSVAPPGG